MGDVVSFNHYKFMREVVVMNLPCERPFHRDEYVLALAQKRCERCNVDVKRVSHPSFPDGVERWHG